MYVICQFMSMNQGALILYTNYMWLEEQGSIKCYGSDACSRIVEPISLRNPLLLYPIPHLMEFCTYTCPFPQVCVGVRGSDCLNYWSYVVIHYRGPHITEYKGHRVTPTYCSNVVSSPDPPVRATLSPLAHWRVWGRD